MKGLSLPGGAGHLFLLIFIASYTLGRCDGIFKIDFQNLKLPKLNLPLNLNWNEILFGAESNSEIGKDSSDDGGRSISTAALINFARSLQINYAQNKDIFTKDDESLPSTSIVENSETGNMDPGGGGPGVGSSRSTTSSSLIQNSDPSPSVGDYYTETPRLNSKHMKREEQQQQSAHSNSLDMDSEMKSLDNELASNMNKNNKLWLYATTTVSPTYNNSEYLSRPNSTFFTDLSVLKQLFQLSGQSVKSFALCNACKVGMGLFMLRARSGATEENLMQTAIFACSFFKIAPDEMCHGLVTRFGPVLFYIVLERAQLSSEMFCGMILQSVGCTYTDPKSEWDVLSHQFHSGPREKETTKTVEKRDARHQSATIPSGIPTMKILHLTDIHVDPHYRPGATAVCDKEMCCRDTDVMAVDSFLGGGFYGDYRKCDLPYHSLVNALEHMAATHPDVELIYMTGDLIPHNVWSTEADENMEIIFNVSRLIYNYFPNTIVLPVLGNHETHPVNLFSPYGVPPKLSTDWVYATTAKAWAPWIPRKSVQTFLYGGYYDRVINPGFRVIVLNTNLCYTFNFWQMYDDKDPSGQLRWLATELQKSESTGQKVHILGHVPPGQSDCWNVWSKNFYEIVARFSSTVQAQFYGHTHYDEFKLFYHPVEKGRAISPMWIGASLTPFTNLNPGYKIFTVDGARGNESTYHVLDHETWIYNLTRANLNPYNPPEWYRLYKATEAYNIPDVLPESLNKFVHRMSSNITDFHHYYWHYHKAAEVAHVKSFCDALCRKKILCNIVTPYQKQQTECMLLQSELDGVILPIKIFETKPLGSDVAAKQSRTSTTLHPNASSSSNLNLSTTESESLTDSEGTSQSEATDKPPSLFDRIFGSRLFRFR